MNDEIWTIDMDGEELLQSRFYRSFSRYSLSIRISGVKKELFSLNFTNVKQYLEMMIKNKDTIQFNSYFRIDVL